jgi:hypothetical protein
VGGIFGVITRLEFNLWVKKSKTKDFFLKIAFLFLKASGLLDFSEDLGDGKEEAKTIILDFELKQIYTSWICERC